MEGACTNCPHRQFCNTLCPEAELYVKQDEVPKREMTIGIPIYINKPWPEPGKSSLFTKLENKVFSRLVDGKSRREIVKELNITKENLRDVIRRIRRKREKIYTNNIGMDMPLEFKALRSQETKESGEEDSAFLPQYEEEIVKGE